MKTMRIHDTTQRATVEVAQGDYFRIELPENPTTGFRWSVEEREGQGLVIEKSDFRPGIQSSDVAGAGGIRRFVFRSTVPGEMTLLLVNRQPWAPDDGESLTLTVIVS